MNKTELKRLLIYLAFSFGLAYAWFFVTNMKFVKSHAEFHRTRNAGSAYRSYSDKICYKRRL